MPTLNLTQVAAQTQTRATRQTDRTPPPRVEGDEIFPDVMVDITCRVCEKVESVTLDYPALLCTACLNNLSAITERIAGEYAGAMQAFFNAGEELSIASTDSAWYAKTERARGDMGISPEMFRKAWEAARAEGGEKAALVTLRDALDRAAEQMRRAEQRYIATAQELKAARAFLGEPVEV